VISLFAASRPDRSIHVRLLANPADVAATGHAVGYTSASQFSREYRRLFGAPPGRDAAQLQNASRTPD
jgi:AraC-like DNA-binding protein